MITAEQLAAYVAKTRRLQDECSEKVLAACRSVDLSDAETLPQALEALRRRLPGIVSAYGDAAGVLASDWFAMLAEDAGLDVAATKDAPELLAKVNRNSVAANVDAAAADATIGRFVDADRIAETLASEAARHVKRAQNRTMANRSKATPCEWAWVPNGAETCAFCIALASNGWQRSNERAVGGFADHVHAHCDCSIQVRFDGRGIPGYDPDALYERYRDADGATSKEKLNAMRRDDYSVRADEINEQKRAAYARRQERAKAAAEANEED